MTWPRKVRGKGVGMEGAVRQHHHQPDAPAGRLGRLAAASTSPWTSARRAAWWRPSSSLYQAGPDLPRQASGELGSKLLTAVMRPGSAVRRDRRPHVAHRVPLADGPQTIVDKEGNTVTPARPDHRHDPPGDHAGRRRAVRASRATSAISTWWASWSSCRCATATSPSSPTTSSIRSSARACVKITGAHDFNDYACALRHDLPMIVIFTPDAHINENGPARFQGMERYEARKAVVAAAGSKTAIWSGVEAAQDDAAPRRPHRRGRWSPC